MCDVEDASIRVGFELQTAALEIHAETTCILLAKEIWRTRVPSDDDEIPYYMQLANSAKLRFDKNATLIKTLAKENNLIYPSLERIETIYFLKEDRNRADFENSRRRKAVKQKNFRRFKIIVKDCGGYEFLPNNEPIFDYKKDMLTITENKRVHRVVATTRDIKCKVSIDNENCRIFLRMQEEDRQIFETVKSQLLTLLKENGVNVETTEIMKQKKEQA